MAGWDEMVRRDSTALDGGVRMCVVTAVRGEMRHWRCEKTCVLGGYWYGDIVGLGGGGTVISIPSEVIPGFGEF